MGGAGGVVGVEGVVADEVLAGVAAGDQAVLDLVIQAGLDCEIPQEVLDAALANL